MFVRSLPSDTNEAALTQLFSEFGTVRGVQLVTDVFSGQCKGFGFVDMEGHEARGRHPGPERQDVQWQIPERQFPGTAREKGQEKAPLARLRPAATTAVGMAKRREGKKRHVECNSRH